MDTFAKRLADLSPDKRRLLQQLLEREGLKVPDVQTSSQSDEKLTANPASMTAQGRDAGDAQHAQLEHAPAPVLQPATPQDVKAHYRHVYNSLNDQLNAAPFAAHIRFCTFGYLADASPQYSQVRLPQRLLNRHTITLVLEVIGDCDLTGCEVLDVGCGRGGTISVIAEYFRAKRIVGIDLSASAIGFCRRNYHYEHVSFQEGDAEELPFEDNSFDVITNVESSHSYPVITNFYRGVARTLRAGGYFLYTDLFPLHLWDQNLRSLQEIGFSIEMNRDITKNVLLSCDETAASKLAAYNPENDRQFMGNFLGTPDSQIYEGMRQGALAYRILKLKKT